MTSEEKQISRIKAILSASEEVVGLAMTRKDRTAAIIAKETAYDHIKGIIEDVTYNPWQE